MNELPSFFTLDDEEYYDFKCRSCGEKFADEFASDDDVALCKWCNGDEGENLMDKYRDVGMSPSDFM